MSIRSLCRHAISSVTDFAKTTVEASKSVMDAAGAAAKAASQGHWKDCTKSLLDVGAGLIALAASPLEALKNAAMATVMAPLKKSLLAVVEKLPLSEERKQKIKDEVTTGFDTALTVTDLLTPVGAVTALAQEAAGQPNSATHLIDNVTTMKDNIKPDTVG